MSNWEIIKKKQAENIERRYKENPDDWFWKSQMEKPIEQRSGFAPIDGICWNCHKNIADGDDGITLEQLGDHIIVGCPHCHKSYCD